MAEPQDAVFFHLSDGLEQTAREVRQFFASSSSERKIGLQCECEELLVCCVALKDHVLIMRESLHRNDPD